MKNKKLRPDIDLYLGGRNRAGRGNYSDESTLSHDFSCVKLFTVDPTQTSNRQDMADR